MGSPQKRLFSDDVIPFVTAARKLRVAEPLLGTPPATDDVIDMHTAVSPFYEWRYFEHG